MKLFRKKRNYQEDSDQAMFVKWARLQYPSVTLFHIPNGGKRNVREAARLKEQGVLAGVADIFVMRATKLYHGLFIEMKSDKGTQTNSQKQFQHYAIGEGYSYKVAKGFDQAKVFFEEYLKGFA